MLVITFRYLMMSSSCFLFFLSFFTIHIINLNMCILKKAFSESSYVIVIVNSFMVFRPILFNLVGTKVGYFALVNQC